MARSATPTERYKKDVEGMPCYAAKRPMQIAILAESMAGSVPADDHDCAIAQGCRVQLNTPYVSVGRRRTDLALPHPRGVVKKGFGNTTWAVIRFKNSASALKVIIDADLEELDHDEGVVVELLPPKASDMPDRTPRSGKMNGSGRRLAGRGQDKLTLAGVRNLSSGRAMNGLAYCFYCGEQIQPSERPYQRITGWERMAGIRASGKHGGSDITLREQLDVWACVRCISLLREGIPVGQQRLDDSHTAGGPPGSEVPPSPGGHGRPVSRTPPRGGAAAPPPNDRKVTR